LIDQNGIPMSKTFLPLLLAATLGTSPAYAFDSSDPFGISDAQAEKPAKVAKAPREVNPFSTGNPMAKAMAAGGVAALLGPIGLLVGPIAIPMIAKGEINDIAKINAFYTGTVVRGKVKKVYDNVDFPGWTKSWGLVPNTAPTSAERLSEFVVLQVGVEGQTEFDRVVVARKDTGYEVGDILDAKTALGTFALQPTVNKDVKLDFNKHMPRIVNVYCKHDNAACQNDYESSLGVLSRHTDTEFSPSQYLIDPAIIAADQAKMRKEAEESKAALNSGGFSFM